MVDNEPAAGASARIGFGRTFDKPPPKSAGGGDGELSLDSVMSIPVTVQVVLGTTTMQVSDLMKMSRGAIVPLANRVGEPVDVVVNGRVVARGDDSSDASSPPQPRPARGVRLAPSVRTLRTAAGKG